MSNADPAAFKVAANKPRQSVRPHHINLRRSYFIWAVAMLTYVVAIAGRVSFGMASLAASDRFHVNAAVLSLFTVVQVGVYALSQVPVGYIIDRVGCKKVMIVGALLLAIGQIWLGLATTVGTALGARIFVGVGDATAYLSVLRLVPAWFPARKIPLLTQLTGLVGALGQIVAALPFAWVLSNLGWTPAFGFLAALGAFAIVLALVFVKEFPHPDEDPTGLEITPKRKNLPQRMTLDWCLRDVTPKEVVREPGVWLGYFTHMIGSIPAMVFLLLWGVPLMQLGFGFSAQQASFSVFALTICNIVTALLAASFTAAHPLRRSWLVIFCIVLAILAYVAVLYGPTPGTIEIVAFGFLVSCATGASMVGFDFARTSVSQNNFSLAMGIVNTGGFTGGLASMLLMGVILDHNSVDGKYTLHSFQLAFLAPFTIMMLGLLGFLISRHLYRKQMMRKGICLPAVRDAWNRERELRKARKMSH